MTASASDADKEARAAGDADSIVNGYDFMTISGLGPVSAAGWLVATAVGAPASAAFGGTASALIRAMTQNGIPESDAPIYAEGVSRHLSARISMAGELFERFLTSDGVV